MNRRTLIITLTALLAACSDGPSEQAQDAGRPAGTLLGPCLPNKTCNAGLKCYSGICVQVLDGGPVDGKVPADKAPDAAKDGPLPDIVNLDQALGDGLVVDLPHQDQASADQAPPDQAQPDQAQPDQSPPDQGQPDQGQPDQTQSDHGLPDAAPLPDVGVIAPGWHQKRSSNATNLKAVFGTSSNNVYAVGEGGTLLHFTGRWSKSKGWWAQISTGTTQDIRDVWASGERDLVMVGQMPTPVHYDGKTINTLPASPSRPAFSVWGVGKAALFASAENGAVLRSDRARWPNNFDLEITPVNVHSLRGIWGDSAGSVYAVGESGDIIQLYGGAWMWVLSPTKQVLEDVHGAGPSAVFAVGRAGTILFYSSLGWTQMNSPTKHDLFGVWVVSAKRAYAVGDKGTILEYDGQNWTQMPHLTNAALRGIWGASAGDLFAVGDGGTILRFAPCACKVGQECYGAGERDASGCQVCNPQLSQTSLSPAAGGCKVGSACYAKGEADALGCNTCDPAKSATALTPVPSACTISGVCYASGTAGPATCLRCKSAVSSTAWSLASATCRISDRCLKSGELDPTGCKQCVPSKSTSVWSPATDICTIGGKCLAKGTKHAQGCAECDAAASATAWTVNGTTHCLINDLCYAAGTKDSSGCRVCQPNLNEYGWTVLAGMCAINGQCIPSGTKHPTVSCQRCDPASNATDWSETSGTCYIDGKCVTSGAGDGSGCRSCAPTKSSRSWTVASGKCFLDGVCRAEGYQAANGCQTCAAASSQTAWTIAAGKCWISGACYAKGHTTGQGCYTCDPAKKATAWTNLTCVPKIKPVKKVTYAVGDSEKTFTLYTVNTDGTNKAKVPGYGALGLNKSMEVLGLSRPQHKFTRDMPYTETSSSTARPIILPQGKGYLTHFTDYTNNKIGLLHYTAAGAIKQVYVTNGTSASTDFYYKLSVSRDGSFAVSSSPYATRLVLIRLDGKLFPNGKSWVEWTLSSAVSLDPESVTVTNKGLFALTQISAQPPYAASLWWAPTTGTAAPKILFLPGSGWSTVPSGKHLDASRDGSKVVFTGGTSNYTSNLYVLDAATGAVARITKTSGSVSAPYDKWGQTTPSPTGKYVAYLYKAGTPGAKLGFFVAKADGTGTPVNILSGANVNGDFRTLYYRWADDDTLAVIAYGTSGYHTEVLSYRVSTQVLSNHTGLQDSTRPYALASTTHHKVPGFWFSPNRKYLYFISERQSPARVDIKGVELATGKLIDVTTNLEVRLSNDIFAACHKKSTFFFTATPLVANMDKNYQVFMFDQDNPTKATRLTYLSAKSYPKRNYINFLETNADCSRINFQSGYGGYVDIFSMKVSQPATMTNLTRVKYPGAQPYQRSEMPMSQDESRLVYLVGPDQFSFTMYTAPLDLSPCCSATKVTTGPGGAREYWRILGVD